MSVFDPHGNLAYSTVQGGGIVSSTTGTTIIINTGDGFRFSIGQNITVWPPSLDPSFGGGSITSNAEIMRITNIVTNTLTVLRGQEGSTRLSNIAVGYQLGNTDTVKVFTDIESNSLGAATVNTQTTTYNILNTDVFVRCDATSAPFTVTLPTAVGISGKRFSIKKIDATANLVTIATTSSQTIDGSTTNTSLAMQYKSISIISNGSNYDVL